MIKGMLHPEFKVIVDNERCIRCKKCVNECGFGVFQWGGDRPLPDHSKCVACQRCMYSCPADAIGVVENPMTWKGHNYWTPSIRRDLKKQAETGGILLSSAGNDADLPVIWDHLALDACQVTNPPIDPLREPMELRTYLGSKPDKLEFDANGSLMTKMPPQIKLETPILFAPMSFGAVSLNAQKSMAIAARELGTLWGTGEGGLHHDLQGYADIAIVQCASGRFGVDSDYLNSGAAVEIKIGQGAKPGIGGHLPGIKDTEEVSETRMVPLGSDCISPAPHHDIYSIEDLRQLIFALKEATGYKKPISVKIAAVHNVAAIASGIVRAGADILFVDGTRGGTGATPQVIRNNLGLPLELGLAAIDDRLREEGIRNQISIIAAGGIRNSADIAKAIALGADAVAIGTAALLGLGCTLCQKCYTGNCSWGIATQRPELTSRLDPEIGSQNLIRLVRAWDAELKEILGAMGVNAVESLRGSRERLRAMDLSEITMDVLGVKPAGR